MDTLGRAPDAARAPRCGFYPGEMPHLGSAPLDEPTHERPRAIPNPTEPRPNERRPLPSDAPTELVDGDRACQVSVDRERTCPDRILGLGRVDSGMRSGHLRIRLTPPGDAVGASWLAVGRAQAPGQRIFARGRLRLGLPSPRLRPRSPPPMDPVTASSPAVASGFGCGHRVFARGRHCGWTRSPRLRPRSPLPMDPVTASSPAVAPASAPLHQSPTRRRRRAACASPPGRRP